MSEKTMSIAEKNKLIANFMGFENISDSYYLPQYGRYKMSYGSVTYEDTFQENELAFNISYDWLMPVVEKIEDTENIDGHKYQFVIQNNHCTIVAPNHFEALGGSYMNTKLSAIYKKLYC